MKNIGILALQGGVQEHASHLQDCGIKPIFIKKPEQLENIAGLIIPGGESSTLRKLLKETGLHNAIIEKVSSGMKVWGTCAGAILAAKKVVNEETCLGIIDIEINRNFFGAQLDSFTETNTIPKISDKALKLIFIRAPGITKVWGNTEILLESRNSIVAAENENVLVTSFHPELSSNREIHKYFIKKCGLNAKEDEQIQWDRNRWMR